MTYLASPYSHPDPAVREARFHAACRAAADLIRAGVIVFSPVVHSHPLVPYGLPTGWDYWERFDRAALARCDAVAVLTLDGWEDSVGVQAEVAIAGEWGLPVRYVPIPVANSTPTLAHGATEGGG
jgi:hypothetical protein